MTPKAPAAYQTPKAAASTPNTGAMRSKFRSIGPEARAKPNAVESSAMETAVPPAKINRAATASEGSGMVESSSKVRPPDPPMPCTMPTA